MTEEAGGEWGLVVAFPDGSASFVNGFAAGGIWASMTRGEPEIEEMVVTDNEEVIRRMAAAKGYSVDWRPTTTKPWCEITLTLQNAAPLQRANPHGLRVIE